MKVKCLTCEELIITGSGHPEGQFPGDEKRSGQKFKKLWSKTWHITLSFLLGVAVTTVVHIILTNHQVRIAAEAICTVFGSDEQECKEGIDDVLNSADNVTQNNVNVKGE